jgi:hypothetical protein
LNASGSSTPTSSIIGSGAVAYLFEATVQRPYLAVTNSLSVEANSVYFFSIDLEQISGIIGYSNIIFLAGIPSGSSLSYYRNNLLVNAGESATVGRLSVKLTTSSTSGICTPRFGIGTQSNQTGTVIISRPQFEFGSVATAFIPTTTSVVTEFQGVYQDGTGAPNIPRLDYSYGTCPAILLEPQRTNIVKNSILDFSSLMTDWSYPSISSGATSDPITSIVYSGSTAYLQTAINQRPYFQYRSGIAISTGKYTFSFYLETVNGSIPMNNIIGIVGGIVAGYTYYIDGVLVNSNDNVTNGRVSIVADVTSGGTCYPRFGIGTSGNATGEIVVSNPQFETGAYSTSYIPTTTATATRLADTFTRNNIRTNQLITASGGTWYLELKNNVSYIRDVVSNGIFISNLLTGSGVGSYMIFINNPANSGRLYIGIRLNDFPSNIYLTQENNVKIAIKWDGSVLNAFVNGFKVITNRTFAFTSMEFLGGDSKDQPKFIQQMALFNTPLSDSDCQLLTT